MTLEVIACDAESCIWIAEADGFLRPGDFAPFFVRFLERLGVADDAAIRAVSNHPIRSSI